MNRRGFIASMLGTGAALAVDPERALWTPGKKLISIPKPILGRIHVPSWGGPSLDLIHAAARLAGIVGGGMCLSNRDVIGIAEQAHSFGSSVGRLPSPHELASRISTVYQIPRYAIVQVCS